MSVVMQTTKANSKRARARIGGKDVHVTVMLDRDGKPTDVILEKRQCFDDTLPLIEIEEALN